MTAQYIFTTYADHDPQLRLQIHDELKLAADGHPERIRIAADMPLAAICVNMGITRRQAFELRKAARKWVCDQWSFEDDGGVGQGWNK